MSGRRRFRPGSIGILGMMALNAVLALFLLRLLFALFGVATVIPDFAGSHAWAHGAEKWSLVGPLIPGAAICFGLLWFWLILTGRSHKGLSWGSALIYGAFIGLFDVPVAGLLAGSMHGNPLLGLLIGMLIVFLVPSLLLSMLVFGVTLGAFNGRMAEHWIDKHRPQ